MRAYTMPGGEGMRKKETGDRRKGDRKSNYQLLMAVTTLMGAPVGGGGYTGKRKKEYILCALCTPPLRLCVSSFYVKLGGGK
jgi:hypothetical protein